MQSDLRPKWNGLGSYDCVIFRMIFFERRLFVQESKGIDRLVVCLGVKHLNGYPPWRKTFYSLALSLRLPPPLPRCSVNGLFFLLFEAEEMTHNVFAAWKPCSAPAPSQAVSCNKKTGQKDGCSITHFFSLYPTRLHLSIGIVKMPVTVFRPSPRRYFDFSVT